MVRRPARAALALAFGHHGEAIGGGDRKVITTAIPAPLLARVDAAAQAARISRAELIRQALDDRCERAEAAEERRRLREGSGTGVENLGE